MMSTNQGDVMDKPTILDFVACMTKGILGGTWKFLEAQLVN